MSEATLVIDRTHLGRRSSGIERITEELFTDEALQPLPVTGFAVRSRARAAMVAMQAFGIPATMALRPASVWIFPGFPPTPLASQFRKRAVLYVHDVFLLTRPGDLNRAGRLYMAPSFRSALKRLRYFLANSEATAANLAPHVARDAEVRLYRPAVRDVFGLAGSDPSRQPAISRAATAPLVLGAVGTVEPRKNLPAALAVAHALERVLGRPVELHVIGRIGWGEDAAHLTRDPRVRLHGFQPDDEVRRLMAQFDALICTSRDEGLGLPLLEAQYGGLQVIAPEAAVFREVLGRSGLHVDPSDPERAACRIAAHLAQPDWRARAARDAASNVARWNVSARHDRAEVIRFLSERLRCVDGGRSGLDVALLPGDAEAQSGGEPADHVGDLQHRSGF